MSGPLSQAANDALTARSAFFQNKDFVLLEYVECDAVEAFKRLLADGSPRLREALVSAALRHLNPN